MRTLLLAVLLMLVLTVGARATQQDAPPSAALPLAPPVQLFDGESLDGWRFVTKDGEADTSDAWSVVDGVLRCEGRPIGYIETTRTFESYELIIEWRFDPDRGAGNSGVLLRVAGEDTVWPNSIEAQLHSRNAGDIWNIGAVPMTTDAARTNGRRTIKRHDTNEKPLGQWNRYRIVMDGERLELHVNGLLQNTAEGCVVRPGRIGLQSEGAFIEFRRVELRPIVRRERAVRAPSQPATDAPTP